MTRGDQLPIGVIGAGTMGAGIAQVAATNGHPVVVYDLSESARENARSGLEKILARQVEKNRLTASEADAIAGRIRFTPSIDDLGNADLVIEAIIEDLQAKCELFHAVEKTVGPDAVIATNTSSLSVTAIAASTACHERCIGLHFFNPAALMPLVEVVPALQTAEQTLTRARSLVDGWGKTTVVARDTPGFIVNRIARPFYGEALRVLDEGLADVATIDWAMKKVCGFRMGPFELMDLIGIDINYAVTETVFAAFFYDPRYRPSFTQKRMVEAGLLGRKTGRGYYDHAPSSDRPEPVRDSGLANSISARILTMLINEAVDAVFWNVASVQDIDLAMTKGVNYPKGLLRWADEIGLERVLARLTQLQHEYGEDRYRPSPLLRRMVREDLTFY
ncbi:MAG: 3-hydroxybutyryl-CoA dehydrogenase [Acidobacteriota bacterium]|nr:MAG: 3-hydroxybutyryl-CoA dehydrogenase [Acidobacteriota bacterium]